MEDIVCHNDELMLAGEQQEFVQLEQVPFYWPKEHGYGDQYGAEQNAGQYGTQQNGGHYEDQQIEAQYSAEQNVGQYGAQQNQSPTAVYDDWYGAPNIEEHRSFTTLLDVEYGPTQNPGPSTIAPILNEAPQWTELQTITIPAVALPAMTYDGNPVYPPGSKKAPTFGRENGDDIVPRVKAPVSQKVKKAQEKKLAEGPYIKKPLNAFMLFLKENRKSAEEELGVRTSAAVNKLLGQRWKLLSAKEKAKFTAGAKEESLLHSVENPGWSNKNNYRMKRKRSRTKA